MAGTLIGVIKEHVIGEKRCAITPERIADYAKLSLDVMVESGAGEAAGFTNTQLKQAGATIAKDRAELLKKANVIVGVQPDPSHLTKQKGRIVIGMLQPFKGDAYWQKIATKECSAFSMELTPRTTRSQSMDVLSSQSNLAGYKAVLEAVQHLTKAVPMMTTAAGSIKPAKILIIGAGVAGLQAIATAKRLGAIVSAFDVRVAAKEQVESLGAKFIAVESDEQLETKGGYAKETSKAYQQKQQALLAETIKTQDIVITTALIPGRPAPQIIGAELVKSMAKGSVIVDLATLNGGNCALSEKDKTVTKHGVTIIGESNMASLLAHDASQLYSKNLFQFIQLLVQHDFNCVAEDDILQTTLLAHQGKLFGPALGAKTTKGSSKPTRKTTKPKKVTAKAPAAKNRSTSKPSARKKTINSKDTVRRTKTPRTKTKKPTSKG